MKRPLVIHPIFFALFPIIFLLSHNIEQVNTLDREVVIIAGVLLVATVAICSLLSILLRSAQKAGIIVSLFLVLFFAYGHIYRLIEGFGIEIGRFNFGENKILFPLWCAFLLGGTIWIFRTRRSLVGITVFLNLMGAVLVIISLFPPLIYRVKRNLGSQASTGVSDKESAMVSARSGMHPSNTLQDILIDQDSVPDIYYLILDSYPSAEVLKYHYKYDNSDFLNVLREKGFYIAEQSKSNYAMTYLSLASSLNMEYLDHLTQIIGIDSADRAIPYRMINDNKVCNMLRKYGYKIIMFRSGWGPTDNNQWANLQFGHWTANEFWMVLIQTTMLKPWAGIIIGNQARARVLFTFRTIAEIANEYSPKYVFAHFLPPHPPYLFGRHGEPILNSDLEMNGNVWSQKMAYVNQLIFVNNKVTEMVNHIIYSSKRKPIIILQADHGIWGGGNKVRMQILNALYLPGIDKKDLYSSITPVNTFRYIFDKYFRKDIPILNDHSYFSYYEKPYEFIEISDN